MFLVMVLTMFALPAMAETADTAAATGLGDILSKLILGVAGVLASALISLIGYLAQKFVKPWLQEKRLFDLAKQLVAAAEAELGRHTGSLKWEQVSEWLAIKGLNIDTIEVRQAVKAAWLDLNNEMIALGLKEPEDPPDNAGEDPFIGTEEPVQV